MDKKLVTTRSRTTPIEVCDILTAAGRMIHVKRHFGSSDLSHLFSQGFVSAQLLQEDNTFRKAAADKIRQLTSATSFGFFETPSLDTTRFQVVYAIAAPWKGRNLTQALPFFSKVNLDGITQQLVNRGYRVGLSQIDTSNP